MGAIIIVDAFWGDSGKGKVAAYLAQKHRATYSARAGTGTNAGHSIFFADGREIRTHQLPCGLLHPDTQLRVGSGVAVDPEMFFAELDQLDPDYDRRERIRVDYRCSLILPESASAKPTTPSCATRSAPPPAAPASPAPNSPCPKRARPAI